MNTKSEKKIFLERTDDLEVAVDNLIKSPAHTVILNIPRDSVLGSSVNNFHLLQREGATAGKELIIESVDDMILEYASLAKINAVNPVFRRRERVISDVLPRAKFPKPKPVEKTVEKPPEKTEEEIENSIIEKKKTIPSVFEAAPKIHYYHKERKVVFSALRKTAVLVVVLSVAFGIFFTANSILPRATVAMTLKKMPVEFSYSVDASVDAKTSSIKNSNVIIPAELLKATRNLSLNFKANGKEKVERSATGTLVVYNAYSSEPQTLVANTRFSSPDGKIFHLKEKVKIPGAKIENSKIIPSQISVSVYADETGDKYNIPPAKGWRIPGFQGTPRYQGFYADSVSAMSGGFIGEMAVPTNDDLQKGRMALETALKESLEGQMIILLAERLKLFDEAKQFKTIQETVGLTDQNAMFSIFGEAELKYLVFDEPSLKSFIEDNAKIGITTDVRVRESIFQYGAVQKDLEKGTISFPVGGSFVFEPAVNVDSLKQEISGRNEEELRKIVFLLPGLERANISLWPFWVKKVPVNPAKINIVVD